MQEYGKLVQPYGLGYNIPEHINKQANELVAHAANILELIQKQTGKDLPKKIESNAVPVRVVRVTGDEAAKLIATYSIAFAENGEGVAWAQLQNISKQIEPKHGVTYVALCIMELSKDMLATSNKPANWDNKDFLKWLVRWIAPFIYQFATTRLNKILSSAALKRVWAQEMIYVFGRAGARDAWEAWDNFDDNDEAILL